LPNLRDGWGGHGRSLDITGLPWDIALGPQPEMVDFRERVAKRDQGDADALVDPTAAALN
jgi:hypothetical protein